jgi:AcrR family transcriptional regulator
MSTETRKYELKVRAERQRRTRDRIVEAIIELHEEVGPARTTVSEIARRADVDRLTVYNHFPTDTDMFVACGTRWRERNPKPDLTAALAHDDPVERVRSVLVAVYGWFRRTAPMIEKIQRDRTLIPSLDEAAREAEDAPLAELTGSLAAGFEVRDTRGTRELRAAIAVALDFWTWRRLNGEGLSGRRAADLMTRAVAAAVTPSGARSAA